MSVDQKKLGFAEARPSAMISTTAVQPPSFLTKRRNAVPKFDHGHRARLRTRFGVDGGLAMPDYELLELFLGLTLRQGDTKPLAKTLLAQFGSLNGVFSASVSELGAHKGVGEKVSSAIKLVEAIGHRMAKSEVRNRAVLTSWDAVVRYCRTVMAHQEMEVFRVLFLDRKNTLIADEVQAKGTVDHVPVYPREIIKRCIILNASSIVLVHNHPSGDPSPSQSDITMTEKIVAAAKTVGVTVHDHLIIGKGSEFSFRSAELI
jgi:DNA repair protein RadC